MIDEVVAEKSKRMFGSHEKADLQIEKETHKKRDKADLQIGWI